MMDDNLDDVLSNIEPEDKKKRRPLYEDDLLPDPGLEEEITIDLQDDVEEKKDYGSKVKAQGKADESIDVSVDDAGENIESRQAPSEVIQPSNIPPSELEKVPSAVKFTVKGNRSWNTREPYVIKVHNDKLKENYDNLNSTIYIVESKESDSSIQGKIKLALLKNITGDHPEMAGKYKEFIYKAIVLQKNDLGEKYNLSGDKLNLFTYHIGVYTLYRIVISYFQIFMIGDCYQRSADNRVKKSLPTEFIKISVLNWFEDNINIYNLPFDGIHEYNEIKRLVSGRYYAELEKYNKKLDDLIIKHKLNQDKKFSREDYFRSKWDEWFGITDIIIYNRFIERTIFKLSDRHSHR